MSAVNYKQRNVDITGALRFGFKESFKDFTRLVLPWIGFYLAIVVCSIPFILLMPGVFLHSSSPDEIVAPNLGAVRVIGIIATTLFYVISCYFSMAFSYICLNHARGVRISWGEAFKDRATLSMSLISVLVIVVSIILSSLNAVSSFFGLFYFILMVVLIFAGPLYMMFGNFFYDNSRNGESFDKSFKVSLSKSVELGKQKYLQLWLFIVAIVVVGMILSLFIIPAFIFPIVNFLASAYIYVQLTSQQENYSALLNG